MTTLGFGKNESSLINVKKLSLLFRSVIDGLIKNLIRKNIVRYLLIVKCVYISTVAAEIPSVDT